MNETQTQALIRFVRVLVVAALTTVGVHLPELADAFVVDTTLQLILIPAITALIESLLKVAGGPTEPMPEIKGRTAAPAERPPWTSV